MNRVENTPESLFFRPQVARVKNIDVRMKTPGLSTERASTPISFGNREYIIPDENLAQFRKIASAAREELLKLNGGSIEERHKIIAKHFANTAGENSKPDFLVTNKIIQQFVKDSATANYTATARMIDEHKANFVIGEFKVPYIKKLKEQSLEVITFDRLQIKPELMKEYPSNAVAVTNVKSTEGFSDPASVSYFRENMLGVDGSDKDAHAYYFINKFFDRTVNYSLPTLRDFMTEDSFADLRAANKLQLENAAANWLSTHEFFHADETYTPLPKFLRSLDLDETTLAGRNKKYGFSLKDKMMTGAFEELRVDILAMLETFKRKSTKTFGYKQDKIAREMILSERLFRYAVMDGSSKSDVASSHVLFNYFKNFKSENTDELALIITDKGKLKIGSDEVVKEALEGLASEILELDNEIAHNIDLSTDLGMEEAIKMINGFMLSYANAHTEDNYEPSEAQIEKPRIKTHDFYTRVKDYRKTAAFKAKQLISNWQA